MTETLFLLVLATTFLSVHAGATTALNQCAVLTTQDKYVLGNDIMFNPPVEDLACLRFDPGSEGSTLDCRGHKIVGDPAVRNGLGVLVGADGVTVKNCRFQDNSRGIVALDAIDIEIKANDFRNPRNQAIVLTGRADWLVTGNKVTIVDGDSDGAIRLVASSPYPPGTTLVANNDVEGLVNPAFGVPIALRCQTAVDNVVIRENNLSNAGIHIVTFPGCSTNSADSILVEDNHITATNIAGIEVFGAGSSTAGVTVRGNHVKIEYPGTWWGIRVAVGDGGTLEDVLIEGNTVGAGGYGGIGAGVYLNAFMGSNVIIRNNTIRGGGTFRGALYSNGAAGVEYSGNNVQGAHIGFSARPNDVFGTPGGDCVVFGNFFGNNELVADLIGTSGTVFEGNNLKHNAALFVGEEDDIVQNNNLTNALVPSAPQ